MTFAGNSVLVTGGASGIGQGIALAFAECGAHVAITHLTSDPAPTLGRIAALHRRGLAIHADLRDATFLCCRAALRHMEPRRRGNIVLVSSLAGHGGGGFGASHYAATKGDVAGAALFLASDDSGFITGETIEINGGLGLY